MIPILSGSRTCAVAAWGLAEAFVGSVACAQSSQELTANMAAAMEQTPATRLKSSFDRPTLTDNWFGQKQAMLDAGIDLRLEWSQFYQGLAEGDGWRR